MEDKEIMEAELHFVKGICDLYLHGTIESTTQEVHEAFKCALNTPLDTQTKTYNFTKEKGWYQTDIAEQTKIESTKQKFQTKCN